MIHYGISSIHIAGDWCWFVRFALWVHSNGLTSLGHDLHVMMHPVQAPQHPLDGQVFGQIWANALDRNDTLCVPLSIELMIAAGTFVLPFGCMTMD